LLFCFLFFRFALWFTVGAGALVIKLQQVKRNSSSTLALSFFFLFFFSPKKLFGLSRRLPGGDGKGHGCGQHRREWPAACLCQDQLGGGTKLSRSHGSGGQFCLGEPSFNDLPLPTGELTPHCSLSSMLINSFGIFAGVCKGIFCHTRGAGHALDLRRLSQYCEDRGACRNPFWTYFPPFLIAFCVRLADGWWGSKAAAGSQKRVNEGIWASPPTYPCGLPVHWTACVDWGHNGYLQLCVDRDREGDAGDLRIDLSWSCEWFSFPSFWMISFIHIHVYWIMLLHRGGQNREIILGTPFSVVLLFSVAERHFFWTATSSSIGRFSKSWPTRAFLFAWLRQSWWWRRFVCCVLFVLFFSLALLTLSLSTGSWILQGRNRSCWYMWDPIFSFMMALIQLWTGNTKTKLLSFLRSSSRN